MGKTRKIIIATGIYPPDIGGPANYVRILEEDLPAKGYSVRVVTFSDAEGEDGKKSVIRIKRGGNFVLKYARYLRALLKYARHSDLIYAQGPVASGLPALLAAKILKKRYYLKIVGDYAWERGRQKSGIRDTIEVFQAKKYDLTTEIIRRIERTTARNAEQVIVPSGFLEKIARQWGVREENLSLVYNSARSAYIKESKEELRRSMGLSGKIIVSSARFVPWKGFMALIDLMPPVLKEYADAKLIIIGEGAEKRKYQERIKALGLEKSVSILPRQTQNNLWRYLKASDLVILNSAYEGLPHFLVEALSLGSTVAASRSGGNPEVVIDGQNGWLFTCDNQAEMLEVVRKSFAGKGGLDPACGLERFSRQTMINKLTKILQ